MHIDNPFVKKSLVVFYIPLPLQFLYILLSYKPIFSFVKVVIFTVSLFFTLPSHEPVSGPLQALLTWRALVVLIHPFLLLLNFTQSRFFFFLCFIIAVGEHSLWGFLSTLPWSETLYSKYTNVLVWTFDWGAWISLLSFSLCSYFQCGCSHSTGAMNWSP